MRKEHGEVPEPIGLDGVDVFLPIKQEAPCDAMDGQHLCGDPASWLMLGTIDIYRCDEHRSDR